MSDKKFVRRRAVLARYDISSTTLYTWVQAGKFPAPIKLVDGGAASAWVAADLDAFDEARITKRDDVGAAA